MTTIRRHPAVTSYSLEYQTDLLRAKAEVLMTLRLGTLPLEQLVKEARFAYFTAWVRETMRPAP